MEFNQVRSELRCCTLVQRMECGREETMETIVPDACPDIARILDTTGFCRLNRREITDAGVLLAGTVQVVTLYRPEGEDCVRRLESEVPFQYLHECRQSGEGCTLLAQAWVSSAETRVVNPRKVLLRVEITQQFWIYCPGSIPVCSAVEAEQEQGVQQKLDNCQTTLPVGVTEKSFTLNDELSLNPGRRGISQVLRILPAAQCLEERLMGTRLVIKGSVSANVLLCGEEGQLYTVDTELPFSQMLEGVETEGEVQSRTLVQVTGLSWGQLSSDGRTLPVSVELLAGGVFYEKVPLGLLSDLFSTRYAVSLEQQPFTLYQRSCQRERLVVREQIPLQEGVSAVAGCHTELGQPLVNREQGQVTVTVPVQAGILYLSEEHSLRCARHTFSVQTVVQLPGEDALELTAEARQMEALSSASGLELRGSVELSVCSTHEEERSMVVSARIDPETPCCGEGQPSVVLFRPSGGECVWDIAKRYHTTCEDILTANGLTAEQPLQAKMLLVPRSR